MIAQTVLNAYAPLISAADPINQGEWNMDIPRLKYEDLLNLITITQNFLNTEPSLYKLTGDFVVVGDLHGNLRDLLRVFACCGMPPKRNYIFLGDYVDRGEFSIEVITLLFSLKISYPDNVYLIRGNHEFEDLNTMYGFKNQVVSEYDENLYHSINVCFGYLPLAAVLNDAYFLVHGGLSPTLKNIDEIAALKRPIHTLSDKNVRSFLSDILWSDPGDMEITYVKNYRGYGCLFGAIAAQSFLQANNLSKIIRSHQCVNAIQQDLGSLVLTVFSSSNYSKQAKNSSGVLEITSLAISTCVFPPLDQFSKSNTSFRVLDNNVDRTPLCFSKTLNSSIYATPRKRRATVDEIIRSNNRRSITGHISLPKLRYSPVVSFDKNSLICQKSPNPI